MSASYSTLPPPTDTVTLTTSLGPLQISLFGTQCPQTVQIFQSLITSNHYSSQQTPAVNDAPSFQTYLKSRKVIVTKVKPQSYLQITNTNPSTSIKPLQTPETHSRINHSKARGLVSFIPGTLSILITLAADSQFDSMGLSPFGVVEGTTFFNLTRIQDCILQGSEEVRNARGANDDNEERSDEDVEEYKGDYGTVKLWDEEGRIVEVWSGEREKFEEGGKKVKKKKRKGVNDAGLLSFNDDEDEKADDDWKKNMKKKKKVKKEKKEAVEESTPEEAVTTQTPEFVQPPAPVFKKKKKETATPAPAPAPAPNSDSDNDDSKPMSALEKMRAQYLSKSKKVRKSKPSKKTDQANLASLTSFKNNLKTVKVSKDEREAYSGQVMTYKNEEDDSDEDGRDWRGTRFECTKHIDHSLR
ncbi:hypothetical protein TL16_g05472 [Triparma laevis f. inornata]|uniref:Uncharacterized protein n=2 Tax=Triparma laevis TaxID=1534972 RepID=A0A9W6ZN61_9STRA|nr:hypothetical protein TrLO_g12794 [Triparma laevis f. longispina]GMH70691.1 hypothetical protein TL16_g05472 [Triparma laevis f. inornata]